MTEEKIIALVCISLYQQSNQPTEADARYELERMGIINPMLQRILIGYIRFDLIHVFGMDLA